MIVMALNYSFVLKYAKCHELNDPNQGIEKVTLEKLSECNNWNFH